METSATMRPSMRRGRRDVVDGIDFGGERDEVVVASGVGDGVAENEADDGADDSDEDALGDEDAADLFFLGAQRHEDGDVFGLFHDHHDQRDEDVEGGDEDDQADGDEGDYAFEAEARNRGLFCSISWCHEAVAS